MPAMKSHGARYRVDLPAEHAQCEHNYHQLNRLLPALAQVDSHAIGLLGTGRETGRARFCVRERSRYTTTLDFEIHQGDLPGLRWAGFLPHVLFTIQLYHDAGMAEVIAFQQSRRPAVREPSPNPHMYHPDEKAQWNRFLGDWLSHCHAHGYSLMALALDSFGKTPGEVAA